MLANDILGLGLNQNDVFRSARNGHATPYQLSMKFSMDGSPTRQSNPAMDLVDKKEFPKLKSIHDAPKIKSTPILTSKGKVVVVVLILVGAAYVIYRNHKAKQAAMQAPAPQPQPAPQAANGGAIAEPPQPAPAKVDNSPSVAAINTNPE